MMLIGLTLVIYSYLFVYYKNSQLTVLTGLVSNIINETETWVAADWSVTTARANWTVDSVMLIDQFTSGFVTPFRKSRITELTLDSLQLQHSIFNVQQFHWFQLILRLKLRWPAQIVIEDNGDMQRDASSRQVHCRVTWWWRVHCWSHQTNKEQHMVCFEPPTFPPLPLLSWPPSNRIILNMNKCGQASSFCVLPPFSGLKLVFLVELSKSILFFLDNEWFVTGDIICI